MSEPAAASLRMTYREACKQALRQALQADSRVLLMGEDIGRYGGCYAVTKGLIDEFGEKESATRRCRRAPIVGAGIGAAMAGLRPIVEIMTVNFACSRSTRSSTTRPRFRTCPAGSSRFRW